jgi:hypothetical protein
VAREPLWLQRWAHGRRGAASLLSAWLACCRPTVRDMLQWSKERPEHAKFSLLFLFAYAFLLRLPSEALPVRARRGDYHLCREGEHGAGWASRCVGDICSLQARSWS